MIFTSQTVQKYILSGAKTVATIRRKGYYKPGQRVVLKVGNKRIHGKVVLVAPLNQESLLKFVNYSGFDDPEQWLEEAKMLHKAKIDPNKFEIIVVDIISHSSLLPTPNP